MTRKRIYSGFVLTVTVGLGAYRILYHANEWLRYQKAPAKYSGYVRR